MKKKELIVFGIIGMLAIFGIVFLLFNGKNKNFKTEKSNVLKNIKVLGYNLDDGFDANKKDYSVEVSEDKVYILCDSDIKLSGCNESVYLTEEEYTHNVIIDDSEKYEIAFKKKVGNENFRILSIDGVPLEANGEEATIVVNAVGEGLSYSFDGGETWKESNQFVVTEDTELQIVIKDVNGNQSEVRIIPVNINNEFSSFAKGDSSKFDSKTGTIGSSSKKASNTVFFESNGAEGIGKSFVSCEGICSVTMPSIKKRNAKIIGWNTKKDGSGTNYAIGKTAKIKGGTTLYAQTENSVVVRFYRNGADSIDSKKSSYVEKSCTYKNDENGCSITAPNIKKNGSENIGWSDSKEGTIIIDNSKSVKILCNKEFYAISGKTLTATFEAQGAIISKKEVSCTLEKGKKGCTITLPSIKRSGVSVSKAYWSYDTAKRNNRLLPGKKVTITKNTKFYAITNGVIRVNFVEKNMSDSQKGKTSTLKCTSTNNDGCYVIAPKPSIDVGGDYKFAGWNVSSTATSGNLAGEKIFVKKDTKLYAIYTDSQDYSIIFTDGNVESVEKRVEKKCSALIKTCSTSSPTFTPKDSSYKFIGWSKDPNATTAEFGANAPVLNIERLDKVYYAIFEKIS